jgi:hypothetical protein
MSTKKKQPNIKNALLCLDMAHASLFHFLEAAEKNKTVTMGTIEIKSLFIIVANAMAELGDDRIKIAESEKNEEELFRGDK